MASVYLTDFIPNSFLYAGGLEGDVLKFSIDDKMLPKESPVRLNTTSLKNMIPQKSFIFFFFFYFFHILKKKKLTLNLNLQQLHVL
jgi:hypothetical protein